MWRSSIRPALLVLALAAAALAAPGSISAGPAPRARIAAQPAPLIALTFDDGPSEYTGRIVRLLQLTRSKATFFMTGKNVRRHPWTAWRAVSAGNVVGNHSAEHEWMGDWKYRWIEPDLIEAQDAIEEATGVRPRWYKPPYLAMNPVYEEMLPALGMQLCWPTVSPSDFEPSWSAERIADYVCTWARPGSIVGLHDGSPDDDQDRSRTARATALIIQRLQARGYRFVTVDELAASGQASGVR